MPAKSGVWPNGSKWCWWLRGAKSQLRLDRPFIAMPKWWKIRVEAKSFLYWSRSVPDGFSTASSQERWKTQAASPWCPREATPNFAGARYCGRGCSTLLYLCSNRSLCCMVRCSRTTVLSRRSCNRGVDTDRRDNKQGAFAPSSTKPWTFGTGRWL